MHAFKRAIEKINAKKWAYDLEQTIEGLKEEVKENFLHKRIQGLKSELNAVQNKEGKKRRLFFLGLESLVVLWGDLLIGAWVVLCHIIGGLVNVLLRIFHIKITIPFQAFLKMNVVVKWYVFIVLLSIIGVVAMSWTAYLIVWGAL